MSDLRAKLIKVPANFRCQNKFKQILLIAVPLLYLAPLLVQPLTVQALPTNITANYPISLDNNQSVEIGNKRLEIGRINLSMSEQQVRKVLGNPVKEKNGYEAIAGKTRTLTYSGMTVSLLEDAEGTGKFTVYKIEVNSPKYATVDGIKVGDPLSKVIRTYGKSENYQSGNLTDLSYPVNSETPVYFIFTFESGRVKTISFGDFLG